MITQSEAGSEAVVTFASEIVSAQGSIPHEYLRLRRAAEVIIIAACSPLLTILICFIAVTLHLKGHAPVFYIQKRIGKHGKVFNFYKFRSMEVNADDSFLTGPGDNRITPIGKILRKYKLDELPQFINILKANMSIIGPRPVPENFYQRYQNAIPDYDSRHHILPGITGLAQVSYKYTRTVEEETIKFNYDLEYIRNISLTMDIKILSKTIYGVVNRKFRED